MKIRIGFLSAASLLAAYAVSEAAQLRPETLAAWDRYVAWTEHRMRTDDSFLVQDSLSEGLSNEARVKLRAGEVFTTKLETTAEGVSIDIPKGLVHHWLGSVFLPGTPVDELVGWLQEYDQHHLYFDEVAYLRFASVYKEFQGASDFEREMAALDEAPLGEGG